MIADEESASLLCRRRKNGDIGVVSKGGCDYGHGVAVTGLDRMSAVSAYHAGRCLDVGRDDVARQSDCDTSNRQLWQFGVGDKTTVINVAEARCLTRVPDDPNRRVTLSECRDGDAQRWHVKRVGNTFALREPLTNQCVGVPNDSRDALHVELMTCTEASNMLWTIEAQRTNDYELLYQRSKSVVQWSAEKPGKHTKLVLSGNLPICRWLQNGAVRVAAGLDCEANRNPEWLYERSTVE